MKKLVSILIAGTVLFLIAVAARMSLREATDIARVLRRDVAPLPSMLGEHPMNVPAEEEAAGSTGRIVEPFESDSTPPEEQVDEEFWAGLAEALEEHAPMEVVLARTASYLAMSSEEEALFGAVARQAREQVERAWAIREEAWKTTSASIGLDAESVVRVEKEIQDRYEREKQAALERVGALLDGGERRRRLRERLDEWFDAVRSP